MSEQTLVLVTRALVSIVTLVVIFGIVAIARKEAKSIDVGDKQIDSSIRIENVTGPVTIAQGTRAPGVQSQVLRQSIRVHLSLFTFLPPSFTLLGLVIWWADSSLVPISNTLLWAALALLIPAIYGEVYRPASVAHRIVLLLDAALFVLLGLTMVAPWLMTAEVLMGMSLGVIAFAIAFRALGRAE